MVESIFPEITIGERTSILVEWQSPERKHFRVETKNKIILELVYDLAGDSWQINEV